MYRRVSSIADVVASGVKILPEADDGPTLPSLTHHETSHKIAAFEVLINFDVYFVHNYWIQGIFGEIKVAKSIIKHNWYSASTIFEL